jgi:hypothetical protein
MGHALEVSNNSSVIGELILAGESFAALERSLLKKPPSDFIISLTTTPKRLDSVWFVLKHLFKQTVRPLGIFLWVPMYTPRLKIKLKYLPSWLVHLNKTSQIFKVFWLVHDFGPSSKVIPTLSLVDRAVTDLQRGTTLNSNPILSMLSRANLPISSEYLRQMRLVSLDDDRLYSPRLLEIFDRSSFQLPHAALAFRGLSVFPPLLSHCHLYRLDQPNFNPFASIPEIGLSHAGLYFSLPQAERLHRADIMMGVYSYLVRLAFFNVTEVITGYASAPRAAFFEDDYYISGQLALQRTPVYLIPYEHADEPKRLTLLSLNWSDGGTALTNTDNSDNVNMHIMLAYYCEAFSSSRRAFP